MEVINVFISHIRIHGIPIKDINTVAMVIIYIMAKKYIQTEKNIISQTVIMVAETMVMVTQGCIKTKMAITLVVIKIKEARVNASSSLFYHQC